MRKILLFALLFGAVAAFDLQNIITLQIPKQDDSSVLKIPAMDLKIGENGIISRVVNNNEFIIANAEVSAIEGGVAIIKTSDFTQMREKYLPKPYAKVAEGDKITFRILYDRALLIAPNQQSYQEIAEKFKQIDFVHSDIFATFLSKEGENMPRVADFAAFCTQYDVGLVFIAGKNRVEILNCQSFKVLDSADFAPKDLSANLPFFTRIGKESIDELFNAKKFSEYYAYFENLVASKNAESSAK